ncbi:MAG TPA: DEAD/DEAH box helicase, partial [Acidimicrobiales bacterium]|nr:DEAD/DEAH box helicase [Acidimicrobiales bacterium]
MTAAPPRPASDGAGGDGYPFALDPFQRRAIEALDDGASVLVAAPTGSGKTVVAEHAVARALAEGGKAFYTTPIKALSNQKFADLARRHGAQNVGLLTGDNSINGDAPVVVMTTEVLRNMIYAGSSALAGLRFVVLDEVHYLQDTYRGPVWEEVIIHLPESVSLVCLSATVSNAEEVADWLTTVRGTTRLVLEEERPVELRNLYLVGDRQSEQPHLLPTLVDGRPNPEAERLDDENLAGRGRGRSRGNRRPRRRLFAPRRPEVIEMLDDRGMLPSLYFIFSRIGCEEAVGACLDAGLRLTTPDERVRIRAIVEERTAALTADDLDVLGYDRWVAALEMGLAAHHAGMVPPFKEAVEACFIEGLVKAVFATETLALGVNMPARSVVIERLTKFDGEARAFLTPGEYTQLTGRAGRRGIDELGYAVVLWSPFVPFDQVASLVSSRTYGLRSAFRPTYNMAANLVSRYEPSEAHHLLNLSFAQFQADQAVVRSEARIERQEERLSRLEDEARCDQGDVAEYRRLVQAEREASAPSPAVRGAVEFALARLMPGDVVHIGRHRLAVLSVAHRKGGTIRLKGIDTAGEPVTFGVDDMAQPPERVGRVDIPRPYQPNNRAFQHKVADALREDRLGDELDESGVADDPEGGGGNGGGGNGVAGRSRRRREPSVVEAHPVHACPDREAHLRARAQMERARR